MLNNNLSMKGRLTDGIAFLCNPHNGGLMGLFTFAEISRLGDCRRQTTPRQ